MEYDPHVIENLDLKDYPEIPESMKKMCGYVLPTFEGEFIQVEFELKVSSRHDAWHKFGDGAVIRIPINIA